MSTRFSNGIHAKDSRKKKTTRRSRKERKLIETH